MTVLRVQFRFAGRKRPAIRGPMAGTRSFRYNSDVSDFPVSPTSIVSAIVMNKELTDRAKAIRQRVTLLRDSL